MYMSQKQQGFSLIEMMVAMLIGLFLIGGVISVYVSNSQSSRVNTGLRTIQENGRFALISLRDSLQMAGFISDYDPAIIIDPFDASPAFTSNDRIKVIFEGTVDCTGTSVVAVPPATKPFVNNFYSVSGAGTLQCLGNGAVAEDIIDGVDQFRILYGLDDDNDNIADRYVTAATVTALGANAWRNNVSSVRIGLLLNSVTPVKSVAEAETHSVLDTTVNTNDRLLHRVFTTTIILRNRLI